MGPKLVLCIVHQDDAKRLMQVLVEAGYSVTRMDSVGGFLRERNAILVLMTEAAIVLDVLERIRANCRKRTQFVKAPPNLDESAYLDVPRQVERGGATVFMLGVGQFWRL